MNQETKPSWPSWGFFAVAPLFPLALALLLTGCTATRTLEHTNSNYTSVAQVRTAVTAGPTRIQAISAQLDEIQEQFAQFAQQHGAAWRQRGYLNAGESDRMESMLFRFTVAQDALLEIAQSLGGKQPPLLFPDEDLKTAAHVLAVDAQFRLIYHRARLVAEFADDKTAVAKLNEAFFRSRIPAGTFNALRLNVTSGETSRRLEAAWVLFEHDTRDADIKHLVAADPAYADLVGRVPEDHRRARDAVTKLEGGALTRSLEHSEAAALARELGGGWGDFRYQTRCLLFKDVSRIRDPFDQVIQFSPEQHAQVHGLLQPGDIILTYTAGYMSDVFIPGSFKHGITYVGSPAQRKAAGVDPARLPGLASPEQATVARELTQATLADGQAADMIEAVAEGVIFNNLSHIMNTHVNRIVVLRPKLTAQERADFLADVFAFRGDAYDFLFDFGDASRQVCTEVIYRGINGRGGINFPLTERGGHPTLSADDVVNYHFRTGGQYFDFVLFAEEDFSRAGHHAVVRTGSQGVQRLQALMAGKSPRP